MTATFIKPTPPEWKPVIGYEGLYSVCTLGVVKRLVKKTYHSINGFIRPVVTARGYMNVTLCKNNRRHSFRLHRLVAGAFLGKRPSGLCVNHKDGDKANNRLDNLEYVTYKENTAHAMRTGLFNPKTGENQYGKFC